jgi:hypothetical protein
MYEIVQIEVLSSFVSLRLMKNQRCDFSLRASMLNFEISTSYFLILSNLFNYFLFTLPPHCTPCSVASLPSATLDIKALRSGEHFDKHFFRRAFARFHEAYPPLADRHLPFGRLPSTVDMICAIFETLSVARVGKKETP